MKLPALLFLLFLLACKQKHTPVKQVNTDAVSKADTVKITTAETVNYWEDTTTYGVCMIPLSEKDLDCMMWIHSATEYMHIDTLTEHNRWQYYNAVRKKIPKEILRVHQMVWSLPEVRKEAQGGDGRLGSCATEILYTDTPANGQPYYFVRIGRDYGWRLGRDINIPFFQVNPKQNKMRAYSVIEDRAVSLAEWRRLKKQNISDW